MLLQLGCLPGPKEARQGSAATRREPGCVRGSKEACRREIAQRQPDCVPGSKEARRGSAVREPECVPVSKEARRGSAARDPDCVQSKKPTRSSAATGEARRWLCSVRQLRGQLRGRQTTTTTTAAQRVVFRHSTSFVVSPGTRRFVCLDDAGGAGARRGSSPYCLLWRESDVDTEENLYYVRCPCCVLCCAGHAK